MDRQPTAKDLRQFGFIVGGIFSLIGLWPLLIHGESARLWSILLGIVLIILGVLIPRSLTYVYWVWMKIGHVLGFINTRIILGIVYYAIITPMGLIMRLMGKDSMHSHSMPDAMTYRVVRATRDRQHMRNQF